MRESTAATAIRPRSMDKAPILTVFIVSDAAFLSRISPIFHGHGFVVEYYSNQSAFLAADRLDRTGCVLIGEFTDILSDLSVLRHFKLAAHRMSTIVMAERGDIRLAVHAMRAGAFDVLERSVAPAELASRVKDALHALGCPNTRLEVDRAAARGSWSSLTERQREILNRIVLGQPNKIIAADLGISQRTAENHRATIMKKMGAVSVSGLIQMVMAIS